MQIRSVQLNTLKPALLAILALWLWSTPVRAQGFSFYFREAAREGKIFVFNSPAAWKTFRDGGAAPAAPITVPGYGPRGEAVVFENQSALDLYNFKHDKIPDDETDRMIEAQRPAPPIPAVVVSTPPPLPTPAIVPAKTDEAKVSWKPGGLSIKFSNFEMKFGFRTQILAQYDRNDYCGDCFNVLGSQSRFTRATGATAVTNLAFTTTPLGNATTGDSYSTSTISVRRIKPYFSGFAFDKRFRWDIQYEYSAGAGNNNLGLREAFGEWEFAPAAVLRIGQWKGPFVRQRMQSDGRSQFVDLSVATSAFAMGFEPGVMLYGNLGGANQDLFEYNLGVFNGTGANPANLGGNPDNRLLYAGRVVWTPFGKYAFGEGETAIDNPQSYKMFIGASGNTNKNRSGVGTLNITNGRSDRWGFEIGGKYKIFSYSAEYFVNNTENVTDNFSSIYNPATGAAAVQTATTTSETSARGWYAQLGIFAIPKKWDFAFRYSVVDPNHDVDHQQTREWRVGTNWYLSESHYHKLQFDIGKVKREFNGKYVNTGLTLPAVPPLGCTAGNFACDDRDKDETQARLQYQFWF